ncbi:MAG TPA: hypothetical protein VKR06_19720 [Ktedonosporobacter sp.]|nr:hypothetical protein [Ktedonosporobacter sp.]
MALPQIFSKQYEAVFRELWLTKQKKNTSVSATILFVIPAKMAFDAIFIREK